MICVATGFGATMMLAATGFTLSWTHSVERTLWQEEWRVEDGALVLAQARVSGSGAGMEPPLGARLERGAYLWKPAAAPVPELVLAASGETGAGWRLCTDGGGCFEVGASPSEPARIRACPERSQDWVGEARSLLGRDR